MGVILCSYNGECKETGMDGSVDGQMDVLFSHECQSVRRYALLQVNHTSHLFLCLSF